MTYGDFILPDNLAEGEYRIFAYTQWMMNFPSYPIAEKSVLVKRFNAEEEIRDEVQLYYSERWNGYRELQLFHTSQTPLLVEVVNEQGRGEAIFEEVAPYTVFNTKIQFDTPKTLRWNNEIKVIHPSPILLVEDKLIMDPSLKAGSVLIHTDLAIIKEFNENEVAGEIPLGKISLPGMNGFQVSVFDQSDRLVAHRYFNIPKTKDLSVNVPKKVSLGEQFTANIRSGSLSTSSGISFIKSPEPQKVENLVRVLNDPRWILVGEGPTPRGNYIGALKEIKQKGKDTLIKKDMFPLLEYNPLAQNLLLTRPDLFNKSNLKSLPDFEDHVEYEMSRKIFHEHFEYDASVSVPVSPYLVDYTYDVPDYIGYRDMKIFLKEVVPQIRVRKEKDTDKDEIRIFNPNMAKATFTNKPLLLIDFYEVTDPSVILTYELAQIDRIEVIYLRNTIDETNLGKWSENGVLALFTKKNDYQHKNNIPKSKYILRDLNVPRVMAKNLIHQEASTGITMQKPQSWHPSLSFVRGRSQFKTGALDEPGNLILETWVFDGTDYSTTQTEIEIR